MTEPYHVQDNEFQQVVLESDIPVIVDFWAVWCGPCKLYEPIMNELALEYDGKLKVCKVDVDNNQQIAMNYGIRSIPTVMIFKGGEVVDQIIGAIPKHQLVSQHLEEHI